MENADAIPPKTAIGYEPMLWAAVLSKYSSGRAL